MKGNNKGNNNSISKVKGSSFISMFLVACTLITGSLSSCGPVSFANDESVTEVSAGDIVVESEETMPEYYAGDEGGTVIPTGVLTSYRIGVTTNDPEAGEVEYQTVPSEGGQTLYASAVPNEGFVLDHWMLNGNVATDLGSDTAVEITDINSDMDLVAVFATDTPTDSGTVFRSPSLLGGPLRSSPSGSGPDGAFTISTGVMTQQSYGSTSYAPVDDGGTVSGGLNSGESTPTQINAVAKPGYVFDHWDITITYPDKSVTDNYIEYSNPVTIYLYLDDSGKNTKNGHANCIAYFNIKDTKISLASMAPDQLAGKVEYNSNPLNVGAAPVSYTAGGSISVTAHAGYYIDSVSFTDSEGVSHTFRPSGSRQTGFSFSIPAEFCKDDIYLHAEFTKSKYVIKVIDDPPSGGRTQIQATTSGNFYGQAEVNPGEQVYIVADPYSNYEFDCFVLADGTRVSGQPNASQPGTYQICINSAYADMTITSKYKSTADVTVAVQRSPEEGGTVKYNGVTADTNPKDYTFSPGTDSGFTLEATPHTGYKFLNWEDSAGNIFNSKQVRITGLTENRTYTAVFVNDDEEEEKGLRVVAEPASGGHVRKKASATAGKVDLTAYPNRGWKFVGWKKEGGIIFSKKTKVTVNDESVTYVGCFEKDKNYRPTTDIVDEHFYNEKRRVTHPNYTVTRQTMENLAFVSVSYDKLRNANDLPGLHGYGAVASVKKYLEGKIAASDVVLVGGILTTTRGEVIGTENIKDIDTLMNSARDITLKKFGNRYDSEIVAAVYTNPPEGFDGQVRTYLWRQTDTQYQDNVYVMYRDNGMDYKEMAAVADEDGTVRFTLEDALVGTEFALVRVRIEDDE